MNKELDLRTITEVKVDGSFEIFNSVEDGKPSIYKSRVNEEDMIIDRVFGEEGSLMISGDQSEVDYELSSDGELKLSSSSDEANSYSKNKEDIIYQYE